MEKEYHPFYWHNKALREHPEYQMEGLMDCLREEMSYSMPYQHFSTPEPENFTQTQDSTTLMDEPEVKYKSIYFKMDRGALELNRRVSELENANKYLLETIKEMRANASKRRKDTI